MAAEEDPLSLKQIISRYEDAEDEFLRELESMQQGAANTDTSDDFGTEAESPVLGTLCGLVQEISQLRRQNRKLRRRLVESSSTPPSRPTSSVVHRMSTFLDASRLSLLPKFMSSSGSSQGISTGGGLKKPLAANSERVQTNLAISSYSTDLSSDSSSINRRRNTPPLVLPEPSSDSDLENVQLPDYDQIDANCLSPCYPRRSMVRRAHRASISDNTSPSSMSAGSSVEPSDTMTSSRSSFLEMIGIRRRRPKPPECAPSGGKKRRRKISETDLRLQSAQAHERSGRGDEVGGEFDPRHPKKARPKSVAYLNPRDIGFPPKAVRLKSKTKSWRSVASRASEEDTNHSRYTVAADEELQDENAMLRNENHVLKTRNAQLIENLRDKSMQLSKTQHKMEIQQNDARRKEQMSDALENLFLRERVAKFTESSLAAVEARLKEFEADLQATKNDALRNQQLVINSTFREQSAFQNCLEQVERLQRENFSLLQTKAREFGLTDKHIREKAGDVAPLRRPLRVRHSDRPQSEDSLVLPTTAFFFQLGQLRTALVEKSNKLIRAELDLMNQQSSLLIAHTQLERMKLQSKASANPGGKRPASFPRRRSHRQTLSEPQTKPHLNVFLPFQLHGSRVEQQRKAQTNGVQPEAGGLDEDDGIEAELLRFFDCSRLNSPLLQERRRFATGKDSPLANRKERPLQPNGDREHDEEQNKRPGSWVENARSARHQQAEEVRRLAEDIACHRVSAVENMHEFNGGITQPNASPVLRYAGARHDQHSARGISLQDISCSNGLRSPSTTPILMRRVPVLGSPKVHDRHLHKQQSTADLSERLDRRPSNDRRPPQGSSAAKATSNYPHFHHHHFHSRLPQPHAAANALAYTPSTTSNGSTNSNGATGLKRSNAILAPLAQTIEEVEEQSQADSNASSHFSRLPKPNGRPLSPNGGVAAAKKAGSSWLSRLRLNNRRP
ncbi:hypothetical protein M3Y99_00779000 [Aphelenchoides fujianensis]|nr:hypothetical protein M3Y99_00779000 [Aphelenchoides fujianensis]